MNHGWRGGQQLAKIAEGRFAGKEPVDEGPNREGLIRRWRRLVKDILSADHASDEPSAEREVDVLGGLA
jgi:hypothetical protein